MNHKAEIHPSSPPCLQHPSDWVDPRQRTVTRRHCLTCPDLRGCAEAAQRNRPSYGMWAGVWIDGDFAAKRHLLGLTNPTAAKTAELQPNPSPKPPPRPERKPRSTRRSRVGRLCTAPPAPAVAALITARASGHCEIMAPACTYRQAAIFARRRAGARPTLGSPADGIAACANCIDLIEHTDVPTAFDLGYLVEARCATSTASVLWRQQRWVYLDTRGRLHPIGRADLTDIA